MQFSDLFRFFKCEKALLEGEQFWRFLMLNLGCGELFALFSHRQALRGIWLVAQFNRRLCVEVWTDAKFAAHLLNVLSEAFDIVSNFAVTEKIGHWSVSEKIDEFIRPIHGETIDHKLLPEKQLEALRWRLACIVAAVAEPFPMRDQVG